MVGTSEVCLALFTQNRTYKTIFIPLGFVLGSPLQTVHVPDVNFVWIFSNNEKGEGLSSMSLKIVAKGEKLHSYCPSLRLSGNKHNQWGNSIEA